MADCCKVFIAVDGSKCSDNAVKWYLTYVYQPKHIVTIGHVTEQNYLPTLGYKDTVNAFKEASEHAKEVEKRYTKMLTDAGIPKDKMKFELERGDPGPMTVDMITKSEAEIAVMGSRGHGPMTKMVLGSVSDFVVKHSPIAVCVCKDAHHGNCK